MQRSTPSPDARQIVLCSAILLRFLILYYKRVTRGRSLTPVHVVGRTARPVRLLAGVVGPTGLLGLCGSVWVCPGPLPLKYRLHKYTYVELVTVLVPTSTSMNRKGHDHVSARIRRGASRETAPTRTHTHHHSLLPTILPTPVCARKNDLPPLFGACLQAVRQVSRVLLFTRVPGGCLAEPQIHMQCERRGATC